MLPCREVDYCDDEINKQKAMALAIDCKRGFFAEQSIRNTQGVVDQDEGLRIASCRFWIDDVDGEGMMFLVVGSSDNRGEIAAPVLASPEAPLSQICTYEYSGLERESTRDHCVCQRSHCILCDSLCDRSGTRSGSDLD